MRAILGSVLLSVAAFFAKAADAATAETFRVIHLHVLQPDGKPASHREVELHGFDRGAIGPLDLGNEPGDVAKARAAGWRFTTDGRGEITARIGNFVPWKDKAGRPGWGSYIFIVQPGPDDAGGASQRFWNYDKPDLKNFWWNDPEDWGQPIPLPPEGVHLTMALQNGYTLDGKLVDERDHRTPLPDVKVNTSNDLHIDTHTGYGGAIFQKSATTAANGEFKIEHLFYARLYLDIDGLWMTTQTGDEWKPQLERVLQPPAGRGQRITCGVLIHADFHYTGTITDSQGQPVAGVDVLAGISSQPKPMTWGDEHHFEHATTDAQGHFDLAASTPWARFIAAEDKTHGRVDYAKSWDDADPPLAPGKYDMQFGTTPKH